MGLVAHHAFPLGPSNVDHFSYFLIIREILMTASSNIKTPTMDVLVKQGSVPLKKAEKLQKQLNRVTLSDVS